MRIHSDLRELLSPLLFVDGSLYTYEGNSDLQLLSKEL